MSRAGKFIQENTRNCSNELCAVEDRFGKKVISYHEWLTPDDTRKAVEIAREEIIEKVCEYVASNMRCDGYTLQTKSKFINNLKQAMKDE